MFEKSNREIGLGSFTRISDAEQEKGLTRFSGESKNLPSIWSKPLISHHKLRHAGDFFERINAKCLLVYYLYKKEKKLTKWIFFFNIQKIIKIKQKEIEGPDHRQNLDI